MGLFYVPATPNIMDLFYVLSTMGLSYVQQIHNIMGLFYVARPGAHNEKQTGRGRSAKRPRSRLKFQIFPTVVELLNLEGEYIRYSTRVTGRAAGLAAIARGRRLTAPFTAARRLDWRLGEVGL